MSEPMLLGIHATPWIAMGTIAMALAAVGSLWVSVLLMRSQDRVIDIQARLVELQRQANWLNGALESHSTIRLKLKAESLGKKVIWWDPTHDGPTKKRPPGSCAHLQQVTTDIVYLYVPPEFRKYPDIS